MCSNSCVSLYPETASGPFENRRRFSKGGAVARSSAFQPDLVQLDLVEGMGVTVLHRGDEMNEKLAPVGLDDHR